MSYNGDIEWGSPSYSGYQRSSMGGFGGSDEYHQELQAFSDAFKQMAFNFNQISEMDKFLTTDRDTQEFRDKLTQKIESTQELGRKVSQCLRRLSSAAMNTGTAAERKERKRVCEKLTKDFNTFNDKFASVVARMEDTMANYPPKPPRIGIPQPTRSEYTGGYYEPDDAESERVSLIQAQRQQEYMQVENEAEFQRALIMEREAAIKKLQSTMIEVHDVFRDIAALVGEQGEMINDIESNIENAVAHTKQAVVEVDKAAKYQNKARSKLCCIVVIIAVLAAAAVISVVIWQVTKSKS